MAEQRLIDANRIPKCVLYSTWEGKEFASVCDVPYSQIENAPTIDPETLPIVQQLREELAKVTAERDAAVEELDDVSSLVDDLVDFVDREIHPVVDYNLYLDLRENVDAISMFQHEDEWRGPQKEE